MAPQSPTTPTQDPADIGPQDLWVVWIRRPAFLVEAGVAPVKTKWMLAAPGEEGLKTLASREGYGEDLLAAMPLALLRQVALALPQDTDSALPKWVRTALGTGAALILVRGVDGSTRVVANAKDIRPGEEEIVRGSRQDFDEILNEGNRILHEKDWGEIDGDMRPFVKRGEVGWLHYQRGQEGAEALKELIEMGRNAT